MAIKKILALGKEIVLPVELQETEIDTKDKFISILRDISPETAEELEGTEYSIKVDGSASVAYRTGAVMG